jgi:hypothetical protein
MTVVPVSSGWFSSAAVVPEGILQLAGWIAEAWTSACKLLLRLSTWVPLRELLRDC